MRIMNLTALGLVAALGTLAYAADKPANGPKMAEMMKKMEEAGTPGPDHERLKPFEGTWAVKSRMWMKPGAEAEESTGTATFSWELGGRYLKQDFHGDWAGKPFEGLSHLGYDKVRREYVNTWMDSMSTGLGLSTGQYDKTANAIKERGNFADPMTGEKNKQFRGEWQLPTNDSFTYTMYTKDGSGREFKSMEMTYTRVK